MMQLNFFCIGSLDVEYKEFTIVADGFILNHFSTFNSTSKSLFECSRECQGDLECKTFAFSPNEKYCLGYSATTGENSTTILASKSGYITFQVNDGKI